MATRLDESSSKQQGNTIFYEHITDLHNEIAPDLRITSLKRPHLKLRLPIQDDTEALLQLFSDQDNVQFDISCDGLDNPEAVDSLIKQWRDFEDPLKRANVVVIVGDKTVGTGGLGWIGKRKADGKMIGDAGLMLDSDYRGQGYAYEALSMIIDHGFRVLRMDEVHIACVDANTAFKGLINVKFGFEATPIKDRFFGNEWIWRIAKRQWYQSCHSAEGRQKATIKSPPE